MESQADLTLGEQTAYRPLSPKPGLPRPKQPHLSWCALSKMAVAPSFHLHTLPLLCMLREQPQLTIFSLLRWKVQFSAVIYETWNQLLKPSLTALVVSLRLLPLSTHHPVLGSLTPYDPYQVSRFMPPLWNQPYSCTVWAFLPWGCQCHLRHLWPSGSKVTPHTLYMFHSALPWLQVLHNSFPSDPLLPFYVFT